MFMSDNGGDAEWHEFGFSRNESVRTGQDLAEMGTNADNGNTIFYGSGWANVSNAPYRGAKHYTHEGGIKSSFIVNWGNGLDESLKGTVSEQVTHAHDFMPTIMSLLGLELPEQWTDLGGDTYDVRRFDETVESLADYLTTGTPLGDRQLAWEHEGNRAYLDGQWKVVSSNFTGNDGTFANEWELYNLRSDPNETNNLIGAHPEIYTRLINEWNAWAYRNDVINSLPAPAPDPVTATARTLFFDHFGRQSDGDIDVNQDGMGGSLLPGMMQAGSTWNESFEGSGNADSIVALNGSLQMATGPGMSNAFIQHNFTDDEIIDDGGLVVSLVVMEINSEPSDGANRFAGFGLGLSEAEAKVGGDVGDDATTYRGRVGPGGATGTADFFVDLDIDGTLRVWDNGSILAETETGESHGEIEVVFDIDSFDAGQLVGYKVLFNRELLEELTGSFTWDRADTNFIGLSARASNYALLDNLHIHTVPEPSARLSMLGLGGLALGRRRRDRIT